LTAEVPSPEVLFRKTVRIAVETAGLALGWIGLIGEDKRLDFVLVEGRAKGYVEGLVISSDPDIPEEHGPGGRLSGLLIRRSLVRVQVGEPEYTGVPEESLDFICYPIYSLFPKSTNW